MIKNEDFLTKIFDPDFEEEDAEADGKDKNQNS